jgi:nucleotide-binding universal stress UspA family protein
VSNSTALLLLGAAWLVIGLAASIVMARRGHDAWVWGVLGALLGPLVIPLAVAAIRREQAAQREVVTLESGALGAGPVSVLVGVDGSADARRAAQAAVDLLGPRLGRVTLATVLDYDVADRVSAPDRAGANAVVAETAEELRGVDARTVVLVGRPADALLRYASEASVDLVAIGARGRGLSEAVLGSVAAQLIRASKVPILVA